LTLRKLKVIQMQLGKRKPVPADNGIDLGAIADDEIERAQGAKDFTPLAPANGGPVEPTIKPIAAEVVDVPRRLAGLARTVQSQQRKATAAILAAGEALKEAHDLLCEHKTGSFSKWVTDKCNMSRPTAYKLIRCYEAFGNCKPALQLADGDAIRKLSTGPDAAVSKAIKLMEGGHHIDIKRASQIVATVKTVKESSTPSPITIEVDGGFVVVRRRSESDDAGVMLAEALRQVRDKKAA
jgi:hypothetical protein